MSGGVTFGAEKEGSSGLLTRVMGPTADDLLTNIRQLPDEFRIKFLRHFLHNYMKKNSRYRTYRRDGVFYDLARDVIDLNGNPKPLDLSRLQGVDYLKASLETLDEHFAHFLSLTEQRPLSFISPKIRMKLFKGKLPGLNKGILRTAEMVGDTIINYGYRNWKPLFGKPERYILSSHNTKFGWEIIFRPLPTYGEFEEFIFWFRNELENAGKIFQAPGHQRMVFVKHPQFNIENVGELFRAVQALIVIDGIRGKTGIETAKHKAILEDMHFAKPMRSPRGVLRLEEERFGKNTFAVEFRAGTKDLRLSRFVQTSIAARIATNDFADLVKLGEYELYTGKEQLHPKLISERFQVDFAIVEKAYENIKASSIRDTYFVPFWHWESPSLPFLSREKKQLLRGLTRDFIYQLASLSSNRPGFNQKAKTLLRDWVAASNLSEDLHHYIRPKRSPQMTNDILHFYPDNTKIGASVRSVVHDLLKVNRYDKISFNLEQSILIASLENPNMGRKALYNYLRSQGIRLDNKYIIKRVFITHNLMDVERRREMAQLIGQLSGNFTNGMIDINRIDLGIEYSGRMPLALRADYTVDRLANDQRAWIRTYSDLTIEERDSFIRKVAEDLRRELAGHGNAQRIVDADGHGHGLDIAYEILDSHQRTWRIEWDGVGRSYTLEGTIIPESVRGGSIELVTPKFFPEADEIQAIFRVFKDNNILPRLRSGGGHINVDLAAFDNNPRALARFIALFHEHRGIISLMFQRINRLRNAEALDISSHLATELADFRGSEEDLKRLLYDERYFNTRYGRKTRYAQLDLSAYFQDVIPPQFITDDFDIKSPVDPWRRQFRVDPDVRKLEMRLFNAPRDATESALQIRLVRALLHKAINEDGVLSGRVQAVDHLAYLANPMRAYDDLDKMARQLRLNPVDFRPAVAEGLSETDIASRSTFFIPLSQRLRLNPRQPGWLDAVESRPAGRALSSRGRQWIPGPEDLLNTITHDHFIQSIHEAREVRSQVIPARGGGARLTRTQSCIELMSPFINRR